MSNFNRDNRSKFSGNNSSFGNRSNDRGNSFGGGRGGFNKRNDFSRGGDSERKEMFDTVCDECGKDCKVPFKPTGDRPVYCSDCFRAREDNNQDGDRGNRRFDNERPQERKFERTPERISDKPATSNHDMSKMMDQLNSMNSKLEKVLRFFESQAVKTSVQESSAKTVEVKAQKPVKVIEAKSEKNESKKEEKPKKAVKKTVAKKKAA